MSDNHRFDRRRGDKKIEELVEGFIRAEINIRHSQEEIEEQKDSCRKRCESYDDIFQEIKNKILICPESGHIKEQNGKLDTLRLEVATLNGSVKFWGSVLVLILGIISIATIITNIFLYIGKLKL